MQQIMDSLKDPELRKELAEEARLDDIEQRLYELNKRVDELQKPSVNVKVHLAVRAALRDEESKS